MPSYPDQNLHESLKGYINYIIISILQVSMAMAVQTLEDKGTLQAGSVVIVFLY